MPRSIIVANKVQPGVAEISKADFEASIERKIDFMMPYDIKAAPTPPSWARLSSPQTASSI
jgi:hypothetical protein